LPEISRIDDKYYISTTSSMIDPYRLTLKDGDLFGVFDRFGDILPLGKNEQGLYYGGTRFLSHYELRINGLRPLVLSSNVDEDDILLTVDLTNPDLYSKGRLALPKDTMHIMRSKVLDGRRYVECFRFRNFGLEKVELEVEITLDSDFKDIFEIRGSRRKRRGTCLPAEQKGRTLRLAYDGLDGVRRITTVEFSLEPRQVRDRTFTFHIPVGPKSEKEMLVTVQCGDGKKERAVRTITSALGRAKRKLKRKNSSGAHVFTSNEQFNESIKRSLSDINMMLTETDYGYFPYGGIPWFCTPFGRDSIITALETLWIRPAIARGVLRFLAAHQAEEIDPQRAAEPGKIIHEMRSGEMAELGEIPFRMYYGSVDSTPLFIMLAGAYWKRTGDTQLIRRLWKNIEAALRWMDEFGDVDGDGFLEYVPDKKGLRNQGWKDSHDSVFHSDGTLAEGPIALCEVQGYRYAALLDAALLARVLKKPDLPLRLEAQALELKENFNRHFWDEELGTYVLALDGGKRPCRVSTSNAGHTLFTGIAEPERARRIAEAMTREPLFSGWGIRTVSASEVLYNPMSYHNGSVWPHDNALIAAGMSRYGLNGHFIRVFSGLFDASLFMEFQRLPELFCGFHRRSGAPPTIYPVACSPQTWAAGALIYMIQASLGLDFAAHEGKIIFRQPVLPEFLGCVHIKNLQLSDERGVDLAIRRYGNDVTIEVQHKPDDVHILVIK